MKITIHSIASHGDHTQERVQLEVQQKCNLTQYIVADTTYLDSGNTVSNKVRHTHWFSPLEVNAGDAVLLYTKLGNYGVTPRSNGHAVHHVYWGLHKAVWNDAGDGALLFEINDLAGRRAK